MDTAHSFPAPAPEPVDPTADTEGSGASFWTGAPKLLAALATTIGSLVALTTVLVQAGVIGSSQAAEVTTPTVSVQSVQSTPQTAPLDATLGQLDGLLAESARTKGDLGKLIGDVQTDPPAIDRTTAVREIDAIVGQRELLHAKLADFPTSAPLSKALSLLRDSITASLADDRLVRQWIVAHYDGDAAANALWQAQGEASRVASEAKRAFRTEYAAQLLANGRPSSIPEY
jgi:hypothetical protein